MSTHCMPPPDADTLNLRPFLYLDLEIMKWVGEICEDWTWVLLDFEEKEREVRVIDLNR